MIYIDVYSKDKQSMSIDIVFTATFSYVLRPGQAQKFEYVLLYLSIVECKRIMKAIVSKLLVVLLEINLHQRIWQNTSVCIYGSEYSSILF